ncbi:MAG TPA: Fe-S protein assembly co-chaperone HscB [Buchnera sp. (in: enterobacteria)]|nr:Fe-S protein assembly co-chaperone HscB [Buchnera sp. (in: enterobacteria)]
MNYFKLFDLPESFNINVKLLTKNFYKLQRQFHPDKINYHPEYAKEDMLKHSILINKGYRVLKDFLKRAEYLLLLNGFNLQDKKNILCDKDFLIEQFNFYEEIEKIKKLPLDLMRINDISMRIKKINNQYYTELIQRLKEKKWNQAMFILHKLLFFKKLKMSIDKIQC